MRDEFLPGLRFDRSGRLAMANSGKPDSGGCQFFITANVAPQWNGKYTIFGQVVEGLDVVTKISRVPVRGDKPVTPVKLIARDDRAEGWNSGYAWEAVAGAGLAAGAVRGLRGCAGGAEASMARRIMKITYRAKHSAISSAVSTRKSPSTVAAWPVATSQPAVARPPRIIKILKRNRNPRSDIPSRDLPPRDIRARIRKYCIACGAGGV